MNTAQLFGKIALVTGASRGVGRAVALSLAAACADVVVNFRVAEREADSLAAETKRIGRRSLAVQADVSKAREVERLVSAAQAELGGRFRSLLITRAFLAGNYSRRLPRSTGTK
jgi:3-oxoacyl-[acyl-carrier protein] reductase